MRFLIDTGATDSIINHNVCNPKYITHLNQPIRIKTIIGQTDITEKATIPNDVFLFPTETDTTFLITKFHDSFNGLLGMDILKNCEINLVERFIKTNNVMMPIFKNESEEKQFDKQKNELDALPAIEINFVENIKGKIRTSHLNREEEQEVRKLVYKYKSVFFHEGDNLTFTNEVKHCIPVTDEKPVYTRSYRYPEVYKDEVDKQMQEMLDNGIIRNSTSPYSSPVWVVPKKVDASGKKKFRIVIDYRKLNEITVEDKFPIPNMDSILDKL